MLACCIHNVGAFVISCARSLFLLVFPSLCFLSSLSLSLFFSYCQVILLLLNMEELLEQINAQDADADADADATATLPAIASLRRWLQSAFLSVKDAPIFLIGSRGDIVNKRTDHERISQCLSKHFGLSPFWPAIVETDDSLNFWPIDNTRSGGGSGSGGADPVVASLRVAIDKAARAQAHARCKLPLRWISLLGECA